MQVSFNRRFDAHWLPFLRVGYGDGGGAPLERSISVGFSHDGLGDDTVLGLGLNWGRPNGDLLDMATDDQYTLEAYARPQLLPRLAVTPDMQLIKNPASNPEDDTPRTI